MKTRISLMFSFIFGFNFVSQGQQIDSLKRPDIYKAQVSLHHFFKKSNKDVVFLGNSITFWAEWTELIAEQKYLKNRGIPGDNSFGVLERLDDILNGKPKMLFLMIGINDLAQGIPTEILLRNVNRICRRTKQISPKTTLIIQSILPTNENFNKLNEHYKAQDKLPLINSQLEILAEKQQVKYLDLYTHFIDSQGLLKDEFSWDGVHLTLAGYQQWVKIIKEEGYL